MSNGSRVEVTAEGEGADVSVEENGIRCSSERIVDASRRENHGRHRNTASRPRIVR